MFVPFFTKRPAPVTRPTFSIHSLTTGQYLLGGETKSITSHPETHSPTEDPGRFCFMAINAFLMARRWPFFIAGAAGAFFCFTSNVDAHSHAAFAATEIRECHGDAGPGR